MIIFCINVAVLVYAIYIYSKQKHSFWARQDVKGPVPVPLIGNIAKVLIFRESESKLYQKLHEQYRNEKVVGLYRGFKPILLIRDPELINQILIRDFSYFQGRNNRGSLSGLKRLGNNLVWAKGETWRVLRSKFSPMFSSKKLKGMVPLIEECINNYINYVEYLIEKNIDHEIRLLKLKYNLQVIASCNFGVHADVFNDEENYFRKMATKIFNPSIISIILLQLENVMPGILRLDTTDLYGFFLNLVTKAIKEREVKPIKRKDFIDLMMELKAQGKANKKTERGISEIQMDDETIAAQAFVFYAAGFETTSGAMSFMIYELALHQDIQNKVYEEVCSVTAKYNEKITYEAFKEMTYLENVFHETLRKYSMAQAIARVAETDYTLPGVNVFIPKGTVVAISVNGVHYDKRFFENPEMFNPDNFSPEKMLKRPNCSYLAFGDGPRNCIGKRLALIQTLMGMAAFIKKFRVEPSAKTKPVLEYKTLGLTLESKDGIWVKILKR